MFMDLLALFFFFFTVIIFFFVFFFFFSSRRRHTISLCDWSSDVCSSDLLFLFRRHKLDRIERLAVITRSDGPGNGLAAVRPAKIIGANVGDALHRHGRRSEERRVGKEGRHREGRQDEKKKERNEGQYKRR